MNRKILIPLLFLSVFLLSAENVRHNPVRTLKEVHKMNHEIERKTIEAKCFANETSKAKQDFARFTQNLSQEELQELVKLIE